MLGFPVDVPCLDGVEPPGLDVVAVVEGHPHDPVEGDPQKLFFLLTVEPDHKQGHFMVRQRLQHDIIHI